MKGYETTGEELDNKAVELQDQLEKVEDEINAERVKLTGPAENEELRMKASVGVFADVESEVNIRLVYGGC